MGNRADIIPCFIDTSSLGRKSIETLVLLIMVENLFRRHALQRAGIDPISSPLADSCPVSKRGNQTQQIYPDLL